MVDTTVISRELHTILTLVGRKQQLFHPWLAHLYPRLIPTARLRDSRLGPEVVRDRSRKKGYLGQP
jgi:hypothetical protein